MRRDNIQRLHKKHSIVQKAKDLWDDFDIWFWRHFVNPVVDCKDRFVYAWERATKGFDRRISWGPEQMVQMYVKMLTNLIENAQARPMGLHEIIPEKFKPLADKWNAILGTDYKTDFEFVGFGTDSKMDDVQSLCYADDAFNLWLDYLKEVRQYFLDSMPETCSQKNEYEDDFTFEPKFIEQEDGTFLMEDNETPEQAEKNRLWRKRRNEIENFQYESLKKGFAEIAKNPYAFSD